MSDKLDILEQVLSKAKTHGADAADAIYISGTSLSVSQRLGEPEDLDRSEGQDLGLRVFCGKRQAIVSSSDVTDGALDELVARAVSMAKTVPEDEFAGLADPDQLAGDVPALEDFDGHEPTAEKLLDIAGETEDAARAVSGVTNSEGASASFGHTEVALAATNGFSAVRHGSRFTIGVSVLAGEGTEMERDYDFDSKVFFEDLMSAAEVGRSAGEKAVKRLNPQKVSTQKVPVIYDPRVAGSMVRHLASAINGTSIARGTSFLKDKMGEQVFKPGITIVDDPHLKRGLSSKPFDAEGLATTKKNLIEDGKLTTWIMDLRSARQLGLSSTGNASRGVSSPPSPSATNLYLAAGDASPDDLIADIDQGFYVTEMIGMGVNGVTGDYSRGATGFWIENGKIAYSVSEMTIAGNLLDMFHNLTPANDLEFRYGTNAPTVRIDGMTVAGK